MGSCSPFRVVSLPSRRCPVVPICGQSSRYVNTPWPRLRSEGTLVPARLILRDLSRAAVVNWIVLKVNHIHGVHGYSYRARRASEFTGCRPDMGNISIPLGASCGSHLPMGASCGPLEYQWTRWFSPLSLACFLGIVVSSSSCRVSCFVCLGVCMHETWCCSIWSRGRCVACLVSWWSGMV